jgi:hypothetical protein
MPIGEENIRPNAALPFRGPDVYICATGLRTETGSSETDAG